MLLEGDEVGADLGRLVVVGLVPPDGDVAAGGRHGVHDGLRVRARHGVDHERDLLALGEDGLDPRDLGLRAALRVHDLERDVELLRQRPGPLDHGRHVGVGGVDHRRDEDQVLLGDRLLRATPSGRARAGGGQADDGGRDRQALPEGLVAEHRGLLV